MKVSVIVTTYNSEKTVGKCLSSILSNDYSNFELLVVDDCSTDSTPAVIGKITDRRLHFFINESNRKVSYSRNIGLKKAGGELILLLDSDAYVDKDWIGQHVKAHRTIDAAIIGGGIVGIHRTIFGKADDFCTWYASIPHSGNGYVHRLHVATNNMSIKQKALDRIGLFDESLTMGGEDTEFCFRARKIGEKIYFKPDILAYHFDRDTCPGFFEHQKSMGKYAVQIRGGKNMDYAFLIPRSYFTACISMIPLAFLFTVFILIKWLRFRPSVVFYLPLIFAGKFVHSQEIKNAFRRHKTP